MTFINFSASLWNDLADPIIDGVGLVDFKSRAACFLLVHRIPFLFFLSSAWWVLWGWRLWTDRVHITLSKPCIPNL